MSLDLQTLESADMTQTQLQIWIAQMLAGRKPVFNMGMAIEISSELDEDLFRQAFDAVVAASDNLRSVFRFEDGGPRRVVLEPEQLGHEFKVLDFTENPADVESWMLDNMRQRIRLNKRLFNSALLKTGPASYTWYICMHHLICDGWSFSNLTTWVGEQYAKLEAGDASAPDVPPFQDFVDSEMVYYRSEACRQSTRFWDEVASDPLPDISLYEKGIDEAGNNATRMHRDMSADFIGKMKSAIKNKQFRAFSEDQGVYLLLLTAMVVMLKRASGNDKFSLAVCLHNRVTPQYKKALGPFFIHSALRVELQPDDTFSSLYKRISVDYRRMLRHYRHPVSAPPGERVWDATVNYVNKTFPDFAGRETRINWLRSGSCTAEELIGLQFHRFNKGDGMEAEWDFNGGIFSDEEVKARAATDFEAGLEFGLANPDAPIRTFLEEHCGAMFSENAAAQIEPKVESTVSLVEQCGNSR